MCYDEDEEREKEMKEGVVETIGAKRKSKESVENVRREGRNRKKHGGENDDEVEVIVIEKDSKSKKSKDEGSKVEYRFGSTDVRERKEKKKGVWKEKNSKGKDKETHEEDVENISRKSNKISRTSADRKSAFNTKVIESYFSTYMDGRFQGT